MKTSTFEILKEKINQLNSIRDKIDFIEWNKDDGPKFTSIKEMKDFENKVNNGELDYIFNNDIAISNNKIIKAYKITKDNYFFYIYTYSNNGSYLTYMNIKNLSNNDVLENLYGYKANNMEKALSYSGNLNKDISNNTLEQIFKNIINDISNKTKELTAEYIKLTSEN